MARQSDLLTEIEQGAHDPTSDIPTLLRKCISLGGFTGSDELRDWASRELKGYEEASTLPRYRVVEAPLLLDGVAGNQRITGQMMPVTMLPDFARDQIDTEVRFPQPIAEISEMLKSARADKGQVRLSPPGSALLLPFINEKLGSAQHVERFYWSVSQISLARILDIVRTTLVELVAEMRAGTPSGQALPSPEVANQVVQFVINGKGNRVVTNQVAPGGQAAGGSGGTASVGSAEPETAARRLAWWVFGVCTFIGTGAAVWALFIRP